jgi:hypothetical protein
MTFLSIQGDHHPPEHDPQYGQLSDEDDLAPGQLEAGTLGRGLCFHALRALRQRLIPSFGA